MVTTVGMFMAMVCDPFDWLRSFGGMVMGGTPSSHPLDRLGRNNTNNNKKLPDLEVDFPEVLVRSVNFGE